ncbi:hypothetical protein QE250_12190 [Chromatiaceae bacterium AAb-1]|jgi:hypothetical protein|nr:hypothetical protein [Chromatiaceae bacterium AAb-1]
MVTRPVLIFEAGRNAQGDYECYSMQEILNDESTATSERAEFDGPTVDTEKPAPPFYIDPNIAGSISPDWVVQANALFLQGLQSNLQGGHTAYLKQMREQFELMRQTLQQQMAQYCQKS